MRIQFIILFFLVIIITIPAKAQMNCLNTLKEAKQLYDQGLIDEIPQLLSGCMQSGFTRVQRVEAYKLIILAYLFDDNQYEAEKTMDEFLHKFPEYEVMPNDPMEFVYLLESYKTSSSYTLNLFFGPNLSNQRIKEPYSTLDNNQTTFSDKSGTGFQIGFGASHSIWKSINLNIAVFYSLHNYSQVEETGIDIENTDFQFVKVSVSEKLKKIDIPLSFTYDIGKGNLRYYARLGGLMGLVTNSTISPQRSHPSSETISENNLDIQMHRNKYYYGLLAGAGLQYKVPHGYLVLDLRYQFGLQNMVNNNERYSLSRLWARYFYIDNDFYLDYFSVNIGYSFSIYQSRKKRN